MLKFHIHIFLYLSTLTACSNLTYYSQAVEGQWEVWQRSQPIAKVLAHPATSAPLKQQLADVLNIRTFATTVLHLPENLSYTYYADLQRPFVVWSVFATPALSLEPKTWCFPIIGCVSYRGYFNQATAEMLATELRDQGYDVYVAGISAYSTLGWFADPVLNTMLKWTTSRLAGVIFHELAHQKLYIADDTAFNEAFATAVEEEGVQRWLRQFSTAADQVAYQQAQQREMQFVHLVLTTRQRLEEVYQQHHLPRATLVLEKKRIFNRLQTEYAVLKQRWDGYSGYDNWFAKDLNNAKLLSVVTYQDYVPAFQTLLVKQGHDLQKFYQAVAQLGDLPKEQREEELKRLVKVDNDMMDN